MCYIHSIYYTNVKEKKKKTPQNKCRTIKFDQEKLE